MPQLLFLFSHCSHIKRRSISFCQCSGSVISLYGSGSESYHQQAKKLRKTLISTALWLLYDFFLFEEWCKCTLSLIFLASNSFLIFSHCSHIHIGTIIFLQTSSICLSFSYLEQDFIFPGPELRLLTDADLNLDLKHPGLRIRIPSGSGFNRVIGSGFGIRIRIQEGKNDPQK